MTAGERIRILAVDVGTGTQDILLFESDRTIENCFHLVMPSPTVIVAEQIRRATAERRPVLLTGATMGGGPSAWAARDHALAGLPCFATADAARTLDDDLSAVEALGIQIVADGDIGVLRHREGGQLVALALHDLDVAAIQSAFAAFQVAPEVDVVAVAAFDHGAAPPGYSDRRFRFDYIERAVRERPEPIAFAYRAAELPAELTRLQPVARDAMTYGNAGASASAGAAAAAPQVIVMDTGAAAVAGALEDATVRAHDECVIANIGNFHTLAFHLRAGRILSLFEHHTGEITQTQLEGYLRDLVAGRLDNERVFAENGHGALTLAPPSDPQGANSGAMPFMPFLAVTGPRRVLLRGSALQPYEAVPHGDMMLAGCFGLLRAVAALEPQYATAIQSALDGAHAT